MNYNGKPLDELSEQKKIELIEALAAELRMAGSTIPGDIKIEDIAELLPPEDEGWNPPRISGMLYKGVGRPGGK